jgi:predicted TPR repeat methyltransferase
LANSDFAQTDRFAPDYDDAVQNHGWNSPGIIHGILSEHLMSGQRVLDVGIGTGLSAIPFHEAGLEVHGIDGSGEMLKRSREKGVAKTLTQQDIRETPWPYSDRSFDHVIACAVFHLIGPLEPIFSETFRLLRCEGHFCFTVESAEDTSFPSDTAAGDGIIELTNEVTGVRSYVHRRPHVEHLLRKVGFGVIDTLEYVAYPATDWSGERSFLAYLARL